MTNNNDTIQVSYKTGSSLNFEVRDLIDYELYALFRDKYNGKNFIENKEDMILFNNESENYFHYSPEKNEVIEISLVDVIPDKNAALRTGAFLNAAIDAPHNVDGMNKFLTQQYIYTVYGTDKDTVQVKNGEKYIQAPRHFRDEIFYKNDDLIDESADLSNIKIQHCAGIYDFQGAGDIVEINGDKYARAGSISVPSEIEIQAKNGDLCYYYCGQQFARIFVEIEYFNGTE